MTRTSASAEHVRWGQFWARAPSRAKTSLTGAGISQFPMWLTRQPHTLPSSLRQPRKSRRMYYPASLIATAGGAGGAVIGGIGFAAPVLADVSDDYFIQALDGYGLQYGTPEKAILVAQTYVCGQLDTNPGES